MICFDMYFDYQTSDKQKSFSLSMNLSWQGHITGIYGPSGSGKSTVTEILLGLKDKLLVCGRFNLGDRVIFDTERSTWLPRSRREIAWVPQDSLLLPHLTVAANLAVNAFSTSNVASIASEFGLTALMSKKPSQLSGGEKQLVALARALLVPSQLIILDEPFSALDTRRRDQYLGLLKTTLQSRGTPALYVSHRADEIKGLCDHLLVMGEGKVQWHGPTTAWSTLTDL